METLTAQERTDLRETAMRVLGRIGQESTLDFTIVVDLGWTAIGVPEESNGAGYGHRERVILAEAAGRTLTGEQLWPVLGVGLPLVVACSADNLVSDLLNGRRAAVGWSGKEASTFSGAMSSPSLTLDRGHVSGRLEAVSGGKGADILLAPAQTSSNTFAVVAVLPEGYREADASSGYLDPEQRLVGLEVDGPAQVLAEGTAAKDAWARARISSQVWLAAESLGLASHLLDLVVGHAREREQFGRPIGTYQAVSHQLADLYAEVELARSSVVWAAEALDLQHADSQAAVLVASLMADSAAVSAAEKAIQVLGGLGMTWESPVHRYFKRALGIERFDGSRRQRRRRLGDLVLPEAGLPT